MDERILPLWRSLMFCPANSVRFLEKAHERGADAVILDLEDSVALSEKQRARTLWQPAAVRIKSSGADVLVRINRELELAVQDIWCAVSPDVSALVVPKTKGPEHIQLISEVIASREMDLGMRVGHTRLLALVETADGMTRINAIASADDRLVGLAVGGEDLATELDAEPTADALYVPKMLGVLAARAAGILPIGVLASVAGIGNDDSAYIRMVSRSRSLGFSGATCVHPKQVPLLNQAFSPGAAQVDQARRIVEAYESAEQKGDGATALDGRMIDRPVVLRARRLLAQLDAQKNVS
ncbi:CoA ester lyase [Allopusillimonas soli]|uniref:CoA ester lyase n=1 Tax=Allopusillimonas soli TaxID=659016 RepID=A0A853F447_9BURK|nr:CoA ester lyase [Allopusillimonas soli]NYT35245.1 CoA ester lyase [Allopusillimonas soli]TEA75673.1 CoA ester lyase [Allopusillimonas soli]